MATSAKKKQETGKQVTIAKQGLPSKDVVSAADKYAGKGISDRQEDNIVPLIYLLQSNSPQTQRGHEKHIKGAVAGDIWLRNSPDDLAIVKALEEDDDGLEFQPCHFTHCWIEWMPDRGGFVARHASRPEVARLVDKERDDGSIVKMWQMPSGNIVAESREYAGFVHGLSDEPLPYTIPMGGTNLTVAKQWMTTMRNEKLPSGSRAPLFANLYRVKTKLRTKGEWSWYVYDVSKIGPVQSVEDVERGAALFDAFESGMKQSAAMDNETASDNETEVDGD